MQDEQESGGKVMAEGQEMSLDKYVAQLPDNHLAARQLTDLRAALQAEREKREAAEAEHTTTREALRELDADRERLVGAIETLVHDEIISAGRARELHGMSTDDQRAHWRERLPHRPQAIEQGEFADGCWTDEGGVHLRVENGHNGRAILVFEAGPGGERLASVEIAAFRRDRIAAAIAARKEPNDAEA